MSQTAKKSRHPPLTSGSSPSIVGAFGRRVLEVLPVAFSLSRAVHQNAGNVFWRVGDGVGHGVSSGTAARSLGLFFLAARHGFSSSSVLRIIPQTEGNYTCKHSVTRRENCHPDRHGVQVVH